MYSKKHEHFRDFKIFATIYSEVWGFFLKFSGYFGSILEIFITFLHGDFERDFSGFGRDLHGDFQKFYDNFKGFIGISEKFWQDIRIFLWIFYF